MAARASAAPGRSRWLSSLAARGLARSLAGVARTFPGKTIALLTLGVWPAPFGTSDAIS